MKPLTHVSMHTQTGSFPKIGGGITGSNASFSGKFSIYSCISYIIQKHRFMKHVSCIIISLTFSASACFLSSHLHHNLQCCRDGKVDEETLRYARQIEQSHVDLEEALNNPDNFSGALSMEGILGLATEVPAKKISSEEETSSDLSLMIYYNNWKGILSQLLPFCSLAQEDCDAVVAAAKNAANCLDIEIQVRSHCFFIPHQLCAHQKTIKYKSQHNGN
jgi:hypothetical protein